MATTVRRREPRDIPSLAQALLRVHAVDGYPVEGVADPEGWLAPPRELASWTAELDGTPVGQISLTRPDESDDAAKLWTQSTGGSVVEIVVPVRLFVDPPHREQGAASALMRAAHKFAADHGKRLVFDVMLKDQAAIRLYEAVGCERLGTIEHHLGANTVPAAVYLAPRSATSGVSSGAV